MYKIRTLAQAITSQQDQSGFKALPALRNATEQQATNVPVFETRWRSHTQIADSATTDSEWLQRQESVKQATKVPMSIDTCKTTWCNMAFDS